MKKARGGHFFSNIVFGVGVMGMTLSSISLMMLISGFVICEVFDRPATGGCSESDAWHLQRGSFGRSSGMEVQRPG